MRIFGFSLMGCFVFSMSGFANTNVDFPEIPEIREVNISPEHVFVPLGFDKNDTSEVIVTGWYPNPCYEWSRSLVSNSSNSIDIHMKALVKQGMDTVCIDMAVPYMESIKLGNLREGESKISVGHIETKILINKANSSSIDDHLYGQVQRVQVADKKALILEIEHPSDCIAYDRTEWVYNGADTCAVLPIMKKVKEICVRNPQTFEYQFPIPKECMKSDKVLFHVRSLGGKAVNFLLKKKLGI